MLDVVARLTSSRSRALVTMSASALFSFSKSLFMIWSDLRPTTNWSMRRLSSWSPKPQSIEEWRKSARYTSTDWPSWWTIDWNRTWDASFETVLPYALSMSEIRESKFSVERSQVDEDLRACNKLYLRCVLVELLFWALRRWGNFPEDKTWICLCTSTTPLTLGRMARYIRKFRRLSTVQASW